ncbi:MAG TPA: GntR family transcriptional regulator [Bryobacteraceae bacterium]|nr:GntR family transcriptional regulator [Bryobacteraceae bacterium]
MSKASIQTRSATPIRLQLSQILRVAIENGTFPAGVRIPSERDLAERYGISRASVRESITELIQAGVLFRTVGKGTFVTEMPPKRPAEARPLVKPRADGICFTISDGVFHFVQTGYNRILAGVEAACREAGKRLYFQSIGDGARDTLESTGGVPEGCIVVGGVGRHVLDQLREQGTPYVLVDLLIKNASSDHIAVRIDYASGTRAAMDYLHGLNHRSFGFIGFAGSEKYKAYWRQLQEYGIAYDPRHVALLSTMDLQPGIVAGYQAMDELFESNAMPTSILVVNDFAALGVLERLKIAGLSVPGDISIIGYDDLGHNVSPPLTTVRVDLHQVGRLAAEVLFRNLNGEEVDNKEYVVPVDLVVRGSTAPATASR